VVERVLGLGYRVLMRSTCGALLGLALLAACGSDEAPADRHEISGSVRDARSDAPVGRASVMFVSDALDQAETTSDADGRFSLAVDVREGVAYGTVRASAAGYAAGLPHSVYFDEQPHVITLQLVPQVGAGK